MTPIPDAPPVYKHREMRDRLQEVIDAVNALDAPEGVDLTALEDQVKALEARQVKTAVVNGAAADTNIAIAGLVKADELVSVVRLDLGAEEKFKGAEDLTAEAKITSDGNIQLDTTNTTGDKLLVTYVDIDGNA